MKPRCSSRSNRAWTITEVVVVMATLLLLAVVTLAQVSESKSDARQIECINNLKLIGLAFRLWAGDNGDKYPAQVPTRRGGAMEAAARGNAARVFQVMSNELNTPKILVCPADTGRHAARNFTAGFDNSHISYFAGVDANERYPQRLLSGDSHLAVDGVPVKSGLVQLAPSASVSWTRERHGGVGNIGMADGSVRQTTTSGLTNALIQTGLATNRLAIP